MEELKLDINSIIAKLKVPLVKKGMAYNLFFGLFKAAFKGTGVDFKDFREFTQNDDVKFIDWKATMKANKLMIREFEIETNIDIFFLLDVSSSMLFGSKKKLKIEYAAEIVAGLSYYALYSGASVGVALFNDHIVKLVDMNNNMDHFGEIIMTLGNKDNYGGNFNLTNAINYISKVLKDNSMVFIVSDFIGLENNWDKAVLNASMKFDLMAIAVRDIRDKQLPKSGYVTVEDPMTHKKIIVDMSRAGNDYFIASQGRMKELRNTFNKYNSDFLEIYTTDDIVMKLEELFHKREVRLKSS